MGWGLELDWIDLMAAGCTLGIVDEVTICHRAKVGRDYDDTDAPDSHEGGARRARRGRLGPAPADAGDMASVAAAAALEHGVTLGRPRTSRPDSPTLLVDHWYSHAVGHVIEALRRCQGYYACDPSLRIALVLNGAAPLELARCAPFVAEAYGVPYTNFGTPGGSPRRALRAVPRDWDYVVHHPAATDPAQVRFEGLRRYYEASRHHFRARLERGVVGRPPPSYAPHQHLRLVLPEADRARARAALDGRHALAVMPAGSSALRALYPSVSSWTRILDALEARFPDTVFVLVGRHSGDGGRTTSGITRDEVDRLLKSRRDAVDAFDRPLLEQLALVEAASLFLSPHTGFGFAAPRRGNAVADDLRRRLARVLLQRRPVPLRRAARASTARSSRGASPLPIVEADEDGEGPRTATMTARRIDADLEEIVEAAGRARRGPRLLRGCPRGVRPAAARGVRWRSPRWSRPSRTSTSHHPHLSLPLVKIVLTLLVRDERDIVAENLAFHLAAGVDEAIVTDHASTDGTEERLARFEREGASASSARPTARSNSGNGSRAWLGLPRRSTARTGS